MQQNCTYCAGWFLVGGEVGGGDIVRWQMEQQHFGPCFLSSASRQPGPRPCAHLSSPVHELSKDTVGVLRIDTPGNPREIMEAQIVSECIRFCIAERSLLFLLPETS